MGKFVKPHKRRPVKPEPPKPPAQPKAPAPKP